MKLSRSQSSNPSVPKSLPLFDPNSPSNHAPGTLNDDLLVRNVITASIKTSGQSRDQIADRMGELLGLSVTGRMIASFMAESKEMHRWPGAWDRAFCVATGDNSLLKCRIEAAGYQVIDSEEAKLLELGREYLIQKRAAERISSLEAGLRGVEL